MTFGEKLTQLRKQSKMTQAELGEKLGVTAQAISKWEHDQAEPDLSTLRNIADLFNISIDDFLDYEKEIKSDSNAQEIAQQIAPLVADSVVNELSEKDAEKEKPDPIIGYCVQCGKIVTEKNKGLTEPKIYCAKCTAKILHDENEKRIAKQGEEALKRQKLKHKRNVTMFWGFALAAVIWAITIVALIKTTYPVGTKVGLGFAGIWAGYALFAVIFECVFDDGIIPDIMLGAFEKTFHFPMLIFDLDLGGIISFILIKVLFGLISVFLSIIAFLISLAISMVISTFFFPFRCNKIRKKIQGTLAIDKYEV